MTDPALSQTTAIVRMLTDLAVNDSLIGIDLADIRTVLHAGRAAGTMAAYGVGEASGPPGAERGIAAARRAIADLQRNLAATTTVPAAGFEPAAP